MVQLTAERRAQLEKDLTEYELAEREVITGNKAASFSHGDSGSNRSQSFTRADLPRILSKISSIKKELGMKDANQLHPLTPCNY